MFVSLSILETINFKLNVGLPSELVIEARSLGGSAVSFHLSVSQLAADDHILQFGWNRKMPCEIFPGQNLLR